MTTEKEHRHEQGVGEDQDQLKGVTRQVPKRIKSVGGEEEMETNVRADNGCC